MFRFIIAAFVALLVASPSHASDRLFVVSKQKRTLEVYDAESGRQLLEIAVEGEPHEVVVSPDGNLAYVADFEGIKNTLSVVDVTAGKVAATVNMAPSYKPHGMDLNADGSRLYVTCEASRVVVEFDTAARKVLRRFPVNEHATHVLALSPDEKTVFAASSEAGNVALIDVAQGEVVRSVISGKGCEGLAIAPDGRELWAVNRVSQTLAIIDVAQRKRVQTLACVGNPLRVAMTPDGATVVATCAVAGQIAVFDRAKRTEVTRIDVGEFPIAAVFDRTGATAYVTNARGNDVAVVDMQARKVVRRIAVGPDPEGIALHE
jgi:YVTN family beta-propeller protein